MAHAMMGFVGQGEPASEELHGRLRRSGGSLILALPKAVTGSMGVSGDAEVVMRMRGSTLEVRPARKSLADRLAMSPKTPEEWGRDAFLEDRAMGRELL